MKIRIKTHWGENYTNSLHEYIYHKLDMWGNESGELENIRYKTDNLIDIFGHLIEQLIERKILSLEDIGEILQTDDGIEEDE